MKPDGDFEKSKGHTNARFPFAGDERGIGISEKTLCGTIVGCGI